MDNATERRGMPCLHLVYGESGAILAALALVNRAYSLLWQAVAECPPSLQVRALKYVERNLGVEGLLNGQSLDLRYGSLTHNRQTTERIALGKTVSLIRLALVLPAQLGGASEPELHLLDRIAIFWGLSYQILDDLKDVMQSSEQSGKTTARDAKLDRPNIALILGVDASLMRLTRLMRLGDRSLHSVLKLRPTLSFLAALHRDLQQETVRLTHHACLTATGGAV
jgi:geranylgeranyl pyrophosphate synthase